MSQLQLKLIQESALNEQKVLGLTLCLGKVPALFPAYPQYQVGYPRLARTYISGTFFPSWAPRLILLPQRANKLSRLPMPPASDQTKD
jgi:hypothetical protein